MARRCFINREHEFESATGALRMFVNGEFTAGEVCPACVKNIQAGRNQSYSVVVLMGRKFIVPRTEIAIEK